MYVVWDLRGKKPVYLLEGRLLVQASPLSECSRNSSVSVPAGIVEATFGFSETILRTTYPFHDG